MFLAPLLLVVYLIGSSLAAEDPKEKKALEVCGPKFPNVDPKVMDEMCEGSDKTFDKDTKCYVKCIGEESGYTSADGKIDITSFKASLPAAADSAKLEAALTKCGAVVKPDACETAFEQFKCLCETAAVM